MLYEIIENSRENIIMKTSRTALCENKVCLLTLFLTLLVCTGLNKIQVLRSVLFLP